MDIPDPLVPFANVQRSDKKKALCITRNVLGFSDMFRDVRNTFEERRKSTLQGDWFKGAFGFDAVDFSLSVSITKCGGSKNTKNLASPFNDQQL